MKLPLTTANDPRVLVFRMDVLLQTVFVLQENYKSYTQYNLTSTIYIVYNNTITKLIVRKIGKNNNGNCFYIDCNY